MRTKGNVEAIYPLTPMQEGMLFHALRDKTSAYFEQYSYRLKGRLDPLIVEKTLNELMKRYDVLRTAFVYEGVEQPVQVVLKKRQADFFYEDLRKKISGNSDEKEKYIAEFRKEDRLRSFDLTNDVLMRTAVLQVAEEEYEFIWSSHHILMDGWCTEILMADYFVIYNSLLANTKYHLPEVKQFRTYIQWLEKQDKQESKDYWGKYLESYNEAVCVPTMNPLAGSKNEYRSEHVAVPLEQEKVTALENLAARNQVTLNTIFQSAWGIILGKYNGKQDVVFAGVVSGRPSEIEGVESMLGMFVNTIPIRVRYDERTRFDMLIRVVQQDNLNSESHHYYPLAEIQSQSALKQDLINHIFVFENYPFAEKIDGLVNKTAPANNARGTALGVSRVEVFEQTNYDFNFIVVPGRRFALRALYNAEVYRKENVERIIDHLKLLLNQVIENEKILIDEITLLSEKEKKQILFEFNGNKAEYPAGGTLFQLFEEQVERTPQDTAVVYESAQGNSIALTYAELNGKANRLARFLREKGLERNGIVGLLLERSVEMVIGILGILKAGGAYLPIDTEYPKNRVLAMLQDSEVSFLLTQDEVIKSYPFSALQNLKAGKVNAVVTPPRDYISELDKLPRPDRTTVDYSKYHKYIGNAMVKHTVSLMATRGCPFRCAFCHKIWPKKHIARSAENILDEMRICYEAGARRFVFIDDIFNFDIENSSRLFQTIIDQGLDVQIFFPNGLRADLLTKDYIDLMVKAGMKGLALALETASPRLQKLLKKNLNLDKMHEIVEYFCSKYPQIILELFTMHGIPTETKEEVQMTMDFILNHKWIHFPYIQILKIFPHTDMYTLAVASGISEKAIERSVDLAYHEVPETLPYPKSFTREYQSRFLNDYFLSRERLLHVLPYQMKVLTEDELVQKYDSYLPTEIKSFSQLLEFIGVNREELGNVELLPPDYKAAPNFNRDIKKYFPVSETNDDAFRILFLDLSQLFIDESEDMLYDMVEPPLGMMYLLTSLKEKFGRRVNGRIVKSRIDFGNYRELKKIIEDFAPGMIGVRSLSFFKEFFHRTISLIRQWGVDVPIITGGPYASSDYSYVLQDRNIDLAVLGEGELTLAELVGKMLENGKKLPAQAVLQNIQGIAYVKAQDKPLLKDSICEVIPLDQIQEKLADFDPGNLEYVNNENDLVYLIYTSGSTGKPKGTMLEHRNLVNLLRFQYRDTNIDCSKILQFASIGFDASFHEIFSALLSGGTIYLIDNETRTNIPELFKIVGQNEIKTVFLPISFLRLIFSEEEYIACIPPSINHIQTAGEQVVISDRFRKYLQEKKIFLHNHYGPAETHVVTTLTLDPTAEIPELPPIGKPILNTDIYILDKYKNLQPIGIPGELYIGGIQVGRGYLRRDELTAEKFIENPFKPGKKEKMYRSGDLARWLPDGNIDFLGRIDQQVKIRGFRVEPGEIENLLSAHEKIKEAVVVVKKARATGAPGEIGDKHLCAYILAEEKIPVPELRDYLSRELPDYMIPSYFVEMDKIPLSPHGKVDYNALPDPLEMMSKGSAYEAPANEMEEKIIQIWADILGLDKRKIGVNDNFFELGGNSLNILRTLSRLNKVVKHKISLSSLFLHKTVKELAENIYEEEKLAKLECVVKLNKGGNDRNLFIIHPLHGMIYQYKELANLLKDDYNVYALQGRGLVKKSFIPETQEIMAVDYLRQIQAIQPDGPYLVAGFCYGGYIAYDMVKLLEDMEYEVETLILFNHSPFIGPNTYNYYLEKERKEKRLKPLTKILEFFGKESYKEQRIKEYKNMVRLIEEREAQYENEPGITPDEAEKQKLEVEEYLKGLMDNYLKTPPLERIRGIIKTDLFDIKAQITTQTNFEEKYLRYMTFGKLTLVENPGDNNTIFQHPNVEAMAAHLHNLKKLIIKSIKE